MRSIRGPPTDFNLLARTSADPIALEDTVRRKIHERDPEVPVKFTTMEAAVAEGVAAPRFRMMLLGLFARSPYAWRWPACME